MAHSYDAIGRTYNTTRREDPRIAEAIGDALGSSRAVVNVGAGTGNYEPRDREVIAVEPSRVMLAQRSRQRAPAVRARAEALPFPDRSFDAALAVLTIHHWEDRTRGLRECSRVARERIVIFTWDPDAAGFWLTDEYFPEIPGLDRPTFPTIGELRSLFPHLEVRSIPIPANCYDGFLGAYWQRPEAYLDPAVRGGMSVFAKLQDVETRLARLRADVDSGAWRARHSDLLIATALDIGYRVIVAPVG